MEVVEVGSEKCELSSREEGRGKAWSMQVSWPPAWGRQRCRSRSCRLTLLPLSGRGQNFGESG